jgi:hypothetical protein
MVLSPFFEEWSFPNTQDKIFFHRRGIAEKSMKSETTRRAGGLRKAPEKGVKRSTSFPCDAVGAVWTLCSNLKSFFEHADKGGFTQIKSLRPLIAFLISSVFIRSYLRSIQGF